MYLTLYSDKACCKRVNIPWETATTRMMIHKIPRRSLHFWTEQLFAAVEIEVKDAQALVFRLDGRQIRR